jgi:hypothetical protein
MAISDLIKKEITLDLSGVPKEDQAQVKKEIIDLVIDEILRYTADGKSPVEGMGSFKKLNKNYADKEKQGNETANLRLEGDMLESLQGRITASGILVGVSQDQTQKADGHCNFSGDSKLPLRRFIPEEDEEFKTSIMDKVDKVIDNYRQGIELPKNPFDIAAVVVTAEKGSVQRIQKITADILKGIPPQTEFGLD